MTDKGSPMRALRALALLLAVALTAMTNLTSCAATGSGGGPPDLGFAGRVLVFGPDGPAAKPIGLFASDGRTTFAYGEAEAVAEFYVKVSGANLYPPAQYGAGRAVCRDKPHDFEWEGDVSGPWPIYARDVALKPGEADRWGVVFFDPQAPPAGGAGDGAVASTAAGESEVAVSP